MARLRRGRNKPQQNAIPVPTKLPPLRAPPKRPKPTEKARIPAVRITSKPARRPGQAAAPRRKARQRANNAMPGTRQNVEKPRNGQNVGIPPKPRGARAQMASPAKGAANRPLKAPIPRRNAPRAANKARTRRRQIVGKPRNEQNVGKPPKPDRARAQMAPPAKGAAIRPLKELPPRRNAPRAANNARFSRRQIVGKPQSKQHVGKPPKHIESRPQMAAASAAQAANRRRVPVAQLPALPAAPRQRGAQNRQSTDKRERPNMAQRMVKSPPPAYATILAQAQRQNSIRNASAQTTNPPPQTMDSMVWSPAHVPQRTVRRALVARRPKPKSFSTIHRCQRSAAIARDRQLRLQKQQKQDKRDRVIWEKQRAKSQMNKAIADARNRAEIEAANAVLRHDLELQNRNVIAKHS
ncbi:hypothetical protein M427DRAFT_501589 [Gonapodya prolifera JEL478]|uniref:Uncharacterized protein n=1 Tax=Gonapodya prolifera (strain JEL478) TaxID=1344416 RepID=A0A139A969_GONPJ|nr:hypothetical protein M427DRAFT_501589 [Gonapodya prolifera JEL478]|eukprot:KXS13015.1 hypothetical protein M427DRAFT_501589 [Gonapodya prolifera JEL478]